MVRRAEASTLARFSFWRIHFEVSNWKKFQLRLQNPCIVIKAHPWVDFLSRALVYSSGPGFLRFWTTGSSTVLGRFFYGFGPVFRGFGPVFSRYGSVLLYGFETFFLRFWTVFYGSGPVLLRFETGSGLVWFWINFGPVLGRFWTGYFKVW